MFGLLVMPYHLQMVHHWKHCHFNVLTIVGKDVKNNSHIDRMPSKQYECVNGNLVVNGDTPGIQRRHCDGEPIVQTKLKMLAIGVSLTLDRPCVGFSLSYSTNRTPLESPFQDTFNDVLYDIHKWI